MSKPSETDFSIAALIWGIWLVAFVAGIRFGIDFGAAWFAP